MGLRLVGSVLLVLLIALIVIISWSYVRSRDILISTVQHDLMPSIAFICPDTECLGPMVTDQ